MPIKWSVHRGQTKLVRAIVGVDLRIARLLLREVTNWDVVHSKWVDMPRWHIFGVAV